MSNKASETLKSPLLMWNGLKFETNEHRVWTLKIVRSKHQEYFQGTRWQHRSKCQGLEMPIQSFDRG
ncbi:putative LIM/homeobox protein LMX-1.2-like isoform X1 [Sesbania bispinosa]|nr:putative LIM/homeobox protein LMX-1.2-like isoform X1 [Sesbania bispinosa]